MASYNHPGVYVEEVSSGARPISGVETAIAAFVGKPPPSVAGDAKYITSFVEFEGLYASGETPDADMRAAVQAYFANGGGKAYVGGPSDASPSADDYESYLGTVLTNKKDVTILVLPGTSWDGATGQQKIAKALAHADAMGNCMLLVDSPEATEFDDADSVNDLSLSTSPNAVLYYPWVRVGDSEMSPPSAYAAGVWARTDAQRGVWKAPAGSQASVRGVLGFKFDVSDARQDVLNPLGVNCLRQLPGLGRVVWGSRTLSTSAAPEWRYVPVRRTVLFLKQSIYNGIQWAVFEPNNHVLWGALRSSIGGFMDSLYRSGAFQGTKASDAYFVRCGLGDTMSQDDIDNGRVIVVVGFAPLKPAEFVIVRIEQKVAEE